MADLIAELEEEFKDEADPCDAASDAWAASGVQGILFGRQEGANLTGKRGHIRSRVATAPRDVQSAKHTGGVR